MSAYFAALRIALLTGLACMCIAATGYATPSSGRVSLSVSPNPAPRGIAVRFTLARAGHARLIMHDVTGRVIATPLDRDLPAGDHEARWDGRTSTGQSVAPGVYFAEIVTPAGRSAQRLVVVR